MEMSTEVEQPVKTTKSVRVKMRGKTVDLIRERYLRNDIPCGQRDCSICIDHYSYDNQSRLSNEVSHYIVPMPDVAIKYLEIFDFPEITGIIFTHTVVQRILLDGGKRMYTKVCNMVRDVRKVSVMFANEFCQETYFPRRIGESLVDWRSRTVYNVGVWYYKHFDGNVPIVIVTEDLNIVKQYENDTDGVLVISLGQYLKEFFPTLETAFNIYESLSALLSVEEANGSTVEFVEHLPLEVLETGIKMGRYHHGILHVNKHHAKMEAFVSFQSVDKNEELAKEILISGVRHRNRAIHGDVVVVELFPCSEWRGRITSLKRHDEGDVENSQCTHQEVLPTGKVIGVLQRNWRDYVVALPDDETFSKTGALDRILTIPYDYRIPKIRILTRQASSLVGQRIVVRIDSWEANSQYPNGHFVRSLGDMGDIESETETILVENLISISPFSPGVLSELPNDSCTIGSSLITGRHDLRTSHLIMSIDPKGCVDVDDALSIRRLLNGNIELGVHIADVTHFIRPNSYTDLDARDRGTTIYLADRCYHMLPDILSSNLCSLTSGSDRFAVSVLWILDEHHRVVDVWYGRTVIHSSYKLAYEIAQDIIDGCSVKTLLSMIPELDTIEPAGVDKRLKELKSALLMLTEVAHVLKARRQLAGALELDSAEIQLEFRGAQREGNVDGIRPKQELDIHNTVAECMIFANHWVAKKIKETFPTRALLRRHPLPKQDQFGSLLLLAKSKGFQVNTASNKSLSRSLDKCLDPNNAYVNKIMRTVTVQAMNMALYFSTGTLPPEDYYHYGLALGEYTHFTSPIRRYSDIIVHRLLLSAVENNQETHLSCSSLQEVCDHLNEKHNDAQRVQRASQELFQFKFFGSLAENDERRNTLAIVFAIRANGVLVYLPRYSIKAPLYLRNKQKQVAHVVNHKVQWTSGSLQQEEFDITVATDFGGQSYHIFDNIMVHVGIEKSHAHASSIKLDLLDNKVSSELRDELMDKMTVSGKEMIKEVSTFQKILSKNENGTMENEYGCTAEINKNFNTGEGVSPLYLLLEDLRTMALQHPYPSTKHITDGAVKRWDKDGH